MVDESRIILKAAEVALSAVEEVGQGVLTVAKGAVDFAKGVVSVGLKLAKLMIEGALSLIHIELFEFDLQLSQDAKSIFVKLKATIVGIPIDVRATYVFVFVCERAAAWCGHQGALA